MEEILNKANELGLMVRGTDLYRRYEELSLKLDADEVSRELLEEYARVSEELYAKESSGAPIEVGEKKNFQELTEKISKNQLIKEYIATQSYFLNLMMQIQKVISEPVGEPIEQGRIIKPNAGGKIITDF
ncbi:MAG TPA: YlbF family regulator [Spirochaetota bacterium]|nr:YlbF family regulator [Spirochaetota bacterium]HNU90468.1 YlbF family regulator [Spirochaetota bacterium]